MTFFKQITILLSLLLMTILVIVMALVFKQASASVQNRLYEDAQNTAASLSLSLGTAGGDLTTMQTMINANFDSGNYAMITLVDMDGAVLYKREKESELDNGVPKWFVDIVDMQAPIASANVSSGWNPVGILHVQSDSAYAYEQLYRIFIDLVVSFAVIYVISIGILYLLFLYILRPLKEIQKQADAITRNEFIIVDRLPYTKEFKDVVVAMNAMVKKVRSAFEKANAELQKLKEREYTDAVTKLKNRKYFINKLPEFLKLDAPSRFGTNMLIALNGVIEANKTIGYKKVDELFVAIANIMREYTKAYKEALVVRLNGTEFAVLLPDRNVYEALDVAKRLQHRIEEEIKRFELDTEVTYIDVGLYQYSYRDTISTFMSRSDNALAKAKLEPTHIHFEDAEHIQDVMGKDVWRETIRRALKNDALELIAYKVIDMKAKSVIHETLTANLVTDDTVYTYGQFIAPAMQLGLINSISEKMFELLLTKYNTVFEEKTCSIRFSNEFLEDGDSFVYIAAKLKAHAKKLRFNLIIEMPDKFVTQNKENVRLYKELFDQYGIAMGVFEFIGESEDYYYLKDLKPLYIKSEKDFFLSLEEHNLNALKLLVESIGIDLIAVGVMDQETLKRLEEREIRIVQGRVVEDILEER